MKVIKENNIIRFSGQVKYPNGIICTDYLYENKIDALDRIDINFELINEQYIIYDKKVRLGYDVILNYISYDIMECFYSKNYVANIMIWLFRNDYLSEKIKNIYMGNFYYDYLPSQDIESSLKTQRIILYLTQVTNSFHLFYEISIKDFLELNFQNLDKITKKNYKKYFPKIINKKTHFLTDLQKLETVQELFNKQINYNYYANY
jgi:hypothetical protein